MLSKIKSHREQTADRRNPLISLKILALLALLAILVFQSAYLSSAFSARDNKAFGAYDFYYYHFPFQVFSSGKNPYNPSDLDTFLDEVSFADDYKRVFLYPPWLLVLLGPLLSLGYPLSAKLWVLLNVAFLFLSSLAVWKCSARSRGTALPLLAATLLFLPSYEALRWGQLGLFLSLGISICYWGLVERKDLLVSLALPIIALKPHLFFLLLPLLLWFIIREGRSLIVLFSSALLALMIVVLECKLPGITLSWLQSYLSPGDAAAGGHALAHKNAVFADAIRGAWQALTGHLPSWPTVAVPALALIGLFLYLCSKDAKERGIEELFTVVLCLSLFCAPYGWFYDHSSLLLVQIIPLARYFALDSSERPGIKIPLLFFASYLLVFALQYFAFDDQGDYFFFPILMLTLYHIAMKTLAKYPRCYLNEEREDRNHPLGLSAAE